MAPICLRISHNPEGFALVSAASSGPGRRNPWPAAEAPRGCGRCPWIPCCRGVCRCHRPERRAPCFSGTYLSSP